VKELLTVGTRAPEWRLPAHDGKTYDLKDVLQRDLALLVFYPGNDTPG
jgi:peroxiredoxin